MVVAPPGSGKTTLLAGVAHAASCPVGWYRVMPEDASEAAFVTHLSSALQTAGLDLPPSSGALDDLLGHLDAAAPGELLLVLDDVHEIADSDAERALARFIDLRPSSIRVVLGSRRPPQINLSRLAVSEGLVEVGSDDLRFRSWEVEELFRDVYREPLGPEGAALLSRRTGGWAAGLQLFHLATSGKSTVERRQAVDALGARTRLTRTYLAANVLSAIEPEARDFMVRTCALGILTGPLCDALLEGTGGHAMLDRLERAQLFTISADDGRTFHYHQVMQTHLELTLADELDPAGLRSWHSRCAEVLEAAGYTRHAFLAYARAEDWASLGRLAQQGDPDLMGQASAEWNELLPQRLRAEDPWLALADARRCLRSGNVATAVVGFRRAQALVGDPRAQRLCREELGNATSWLPGAGPSSWTGWAVRLRAATIRLPGPHSPPPARTTDPAGGAGELVLLGLTALLGGRSSLAAEPLQAAVADPGATAAQRLAGQLALALADTLPGDCATAISVLEQISFDAEFEGHPWLARLARGAQGAVLLAEGTLGWPSSTYTELVAQCVRDEDAWGQALLCAAFGLACQVSGRPEAPALLAEAAELLRRLDAPVLAWWVDGARRAGQGGSPDDAEARRLGIASTVTFDRVQPAPAPVVTEPRGTAPQVSGTRVAAPRVTLACLGGFWLTVDGEPVGCDSLRPRARALLRVLAVHCGQDVHREQLVDQLWTSVDLTTGTRSLQVAVSSVRQLLRRAGLDASDVVRRRADAYRLELPTGSSVDVLDFERHLRDAATQQRDGRQREAVQSLGQALALYSGDLLPEDGPADWVVPERERLRLMAATASAELAAAQRDLGNLRDAQTAAQRSAELDPFRDAAWRLMAEIYEQVDDRSAAARVRLDQARAQALLVDGHA